LKTARRVPAVTADGLPPTPLAASEARGVDLALALIGGELVHVLSRQRPRVVAAARSPELEEGAQLQAGPPLSSKAHTLRGQPRGPQHVGKVVSEQVSQPPLGHARQGRCGRNGCSASGRSAR
jgi:hypothetical protein